MVESALLCWLITTAVVWLRRRGCAVPRVFGGPFAVAPVVPPLVIPGSRLCSSRRYGTKLRGLLRFHETWHAQWTNFAKSIRFSRKWFFFRTACVASPAKPKPKSLNLFSRIPAPKFLLSGSFIDKKKQLDWKTTIESRFFPNRFTGYTRNTAQGKTEVYVLPDVRLILNVSTNGWVLCANATHVLYHIWNMTLTYVVLRVIPYVTKRYHGTSRLFFD